MYAAQLALLAAPLLLQGCSKVLVDRGSSSASSASTDSQLRGPTTEPADPVFACPSSTSALAALEALKREGAVNTWEKVFEYLHPYCRACSRSWLVDFVPQAADLVLDECSPVRTCFSCAGEKHVCWTRTCDGANATAASTPEVLAGGRGVAVAASHGLGPADSGAHPADTSGAHPADTSGAHPQTPDTSGTHPETPAEEQKLLGPAEIALPDTSGPVDAMSLLTVAATVLLAAALLSVLYRVVHQRSEQQAVSRLTARLQQRRQDRKVTPLHLAADLASPGSDVKRAWVFADGPCPWDSVGPTPSTADTEADRNPFSEFGAEFSETARLWAERDPAVKGPARKYSV